MSQKSKITGLEAEIMLDGLSELCKVLNDITIETSKALDAALAIMLNYEPPRWELLLPLAAIGCLAFGWMLTA